jgi:hypothetical protein
MKTYVLMAAVVLMASTLASSSGLAASRHSYTYCVQRALNLGFTYSDLHNPITRQQARRVIRRCQQGR